MDIRFRYIFSKSNSLLEEGKVIEFCDTILDLFNKYDCNCFLQGQSDKDYKSQMQLMDKFESDNLKYMVVKGFYYYKNNLHEQAYEILTSVIENDFTNDFAYHFRSFIKKEINPFRIEDAKDAIVLRPTARFYKRLADIIYIDKKDSQLAIKYYSTAINLNNRFACGYLNRGTIHLNSKDYNSASEDFKKNIELEKTERGYIALMRSLIGEKKYVEAENTYNIGYQYLSFLNKSLYKGIFHYYNKKYDDAVHELRYYLKMDPSHNYANELLVYCEKIVLRSALSDARTAFKNGKMGRAQSKYELCIENDIALTEEDINNYFNSITSFNLSQSLYNSVSTLQNMPYGWFSKVPSLSLEDRLEFEDFKIFSHDSIFEGGKYKASTVSDIMTSDPDYVLAVIIRNVHFILDKSLFYDKRLIKNELYRDALIANLIKLHIIEKWTLKTIKDQPYKEIDFDFYDPKQNKRDTFDYLSGSQLGGYDDYEGDIDDVLDWGGR